MLSLEKRTEYEKSISIVKFFKSFEITIFSRYESILALEMSPKTGAKTGDFNLLT